MGPSYLLDESERYTQAGHLTIPISQEIVNGKKPRSPLKVQVPGQNTREASMIEYTEKNGLLPITRQWNLWRSQ
jgi:hypothetical protein